LPRGGKNSLRSNSFCREKRVGKMEKGSFQFARGRKVGRSTFLFATEGSGGGGGEGTGIFFFKGERRRNFFLKPGDFKERLFPNSEGRKGEFLIPNFQQKSSVVYFFTAEGKRGKRAHVVTGGKGNSRNLFLCHTGKRKGGKLSAFPPRETSERGKGKHPLI